MKIRIPLLLTALSLIPPMANAVDFVWPSHGTISFDVPETWTLSGRQAAEVGYAFSARPKSHAAALVQITLMDTPAEHPVQAANLPEQLQTSVQDYLSGSVEKKFTAQALTLKQGKGWMVELTDASLVGKPPVPDNYKVMRNGLLALDDHALVIVTMQFDDSKGPEATEMLKLVSSMRFTRGTKSGQLAQTQPAGNFEFTVSESKLRLKFPANGLTQDTERIGGGTNNPRYFKLSGQTTNPTANIIVSGWFEPSSRYDGLKKLWAGDTAEWKKNGLPPPVNVAFLKSDKWELIAYDMPLLEGTNCHIRAELTQAGTWIDLHFSLTSRQSAREAREQLLAVLKSIEVIEK